MPPRDGGGTTSRGRADVVGVAALGIGRSLPAPGWSFPGTPARAKNGDAQGTGRARVPVGTSVLPPFGSAVKLGARVKNGGDVKGDAEEEATRVQCRQYSPPVRHRGRPAPHSALGGHGRPRACPRPAPPPPPRRSGARTPARRRPSSARSPPRIRTPPPSRGRPSCGRSAAARRRGSSCRGRSCASKASCPASSAPRRRVTFTVGTVSYKTTATRTFLAPALQRRAV